MSKVLNLEYVNPRTKTKSTGKMEIKNQTPSSADLYFYGDIVDSTWSAWQKEDRCPQDVADFLNGLNGAKNMNIYINSGGGDSFAGLAIFNILERNTAKKDVYVDALAASAAGPIALVGCLEGNTLHMPPGTQLMMHNCWTIAMGNANDFETLIAAMRKCDQSYVDIFMKCAVEGVTAEQFKAMMDAEKWMSGTEVAEYFKNVQTEGAQIAASIDSVYFSQYRNIPESLRNQKPPAEDESKLAKARLALELSL